MSDLGEFRFPRARARGRSSWAAAGDLGDARTGSRCNAPPEPHLPVRGRPRRILWPTTGSRDPEVRPICGDTLREADEVAEARAGPEAHQQVDVLSCMLMTSATSRRVRGFRYSTPL